MDQKIEQLEKEIREKRKLPIEEQNKINKKIFENLIIAVIVMLYFYFINLGSLNISEKSFQTDLKVFSISSIVITIILFEVSYKKDNGNIAIHGIEMLFFSIVTLLSIYAKSFLSIQFNSIITTISLLFGIYYVGKSIIIYLKMNNEYQRKNSDISDIVKPVEPEKVEETKKRRKKSKTTTKKKKTKSK